MKKNVVLVGVLVAICLISWLSFGTQTVQKNGDYKEFVQQGDELVERGLYQRAIVNYLDAIEIKNDAGIFEKIADAYCLRYEEAPDVTLEDFMDFLEDALVIHPGNKKLVDNYIKLCEVTGDYEDMYNCIVNAMENGYVDSDAEQLLRQVKYTYKVRRNVYHDIKQSMGDAYVINRNGYWNVYDISNGYMFTEEYEFIGLVGEDGIVVVTGKDSRIIDGEGMVLGIFEEKITDAGVFSEDLIPACSNGVYAYYNDYAEKQFGEYEMAGTFQDGKAAIKKDGKWMLIDDEGEVDSKEFDEIVLDYAGRYLLNDTILVKGSDAKFLLYDDKLKDSVEIDCEAVDVNSEDGLIAASSLGKWGFVNEDGEWIIEPQYDNARSFSNGVAAVVKDGKWGFIDKENNLVIDYQFADALYMSELGICPVKIYNGEDTVQENIDDTESEEILEEWALLELVLGITEE